MSIGKFVRELVLNNPELKNEEVLEKVKKHFPQAKTTYACIAWYKSDMRKKGLIAKRVVTRESVEENIAQLKEQLKKAEELLASLEVEEEPQEEEVTE